MSLSPLFPIGLLFSIVAAILIVGYAFSAQIGAAWRKAREARKKRIEERKKKAQEELDKLKEASKPQSIPPTGLVLPPGSAPLNQVPKTRYADLEELATKKGIEIEIGRRALESNKRAVVARGRVYLQPRRTQKDLFAFDFKDNTYYIDPKFIIVVAQKKGPPRLRLYYDIRASEPLDQYGDVSFNQDLEDLQTNDVMDQYIVACTFQGQFILTPQIIKLMIIAFVLLLPLGIGIDAAFHLIPQTNIHWVRG